MFRDRALDIIKQGGFTEAASEALLVLAMILGVIMFAFITDVLFKRILVRAIKALASRTKTVWDDALVELGIFDRMAHIAPAMIAYFFVPILFPDAEELGMIVRALASLYVILVVGRVAFAALDVFYAMLSSKSEAEKLPLKGFVQALKIIVFMGTGIFALSVLTSRTPLYFLSGMGALTAVILLVFKDVILGLVAGVQLSVNNMVRPGDWIEMPQYGADGEVTEVLLTTVKVQNWDKTISNIPAYALVSSTFRNWRGMQESGGRRIKRAINIDMSSIAFLDGPALERLKMVESLREYLDSKQQEIEHYNRMHDTSSAVNGRRLTNIGTFRAYVERYLAANPMINKEMTFLVRQLQPTSEGLPLEIYVFCRDKVWANYEAVQSDIFDHLLAVLPEFGLRVFQKPTGADLHSSPVSAKGIASSAD